LTTSTSSTISAGSYWRAWGSKTLVKVIVPYAAIWPRRDSGSVVAFRTYSDGKGAPIVQYYSAVDDFLADFTPAIWDKEKLTWL